MTSSIKAPLAGPSRGGGGRSPGSISRSNTSKRIATNRGNSSSMGNRSITRSPRFGLFNRRSGGRRGGGCCGCCCCLLIVGVLIVLFVMGTLQQLITSIFGT